MDFQCTHCGKCCLTIPCVFAQAKFNLTSGSKEVCPELIKEPTGYKCLLIERDPEAREVLLSGDCDDPQLAHLKRKFDPVKIVKEYFPKATDRGIEDILWSHTGFPEFWNIPEDGWTNVQCLRKQLTNLVNRSTQPPPS